MEAFRMPQSLALADACRPVDAMVEPLSRPPALRALPLVPQDAARWLESDLFGGEVAWVPPQ